MSSINTPLIPSQYSYSRPRRRGVPVAAVVTIPMVLVILLLGVVVYVEQAGWDRQRAATDTANSRLANATTALGQAEDKLATAQQQLSTTRQDLAKGDAKVSDLSAKVAELKASRLALIGCLGGWLKAFSAQSNNDMDTVLSEVNGVRGVCRTALTPLGSGDEGTQGLDQAGSAI